jgi:hypothetical protein
MADKNTEKESPKRERSLSDLPGYEQELAKLKEQRIKDQKKNKSYQIRSVLGSIIAIPISGIIVYYIINTEFFIAFLELNVEMVRNIGTIVMVMFIIFELQAVFKFIKTLFINPEVITEETLEYLELTAKEHILDPKGSVLREKYGTGKWSAVTST